MPGFYKTMGTVSSDPASEDNPRIRKKEVVRQPFTCKYLSSTAAGNVLWPGEQAAFTFQLVNASSEPLKGAGQVELIAYGIKGRPGDMWVSDMFRIGSCGAVGFDFDLAPGRRQDITVNPQIPERFGAYALVVDLGDAGRLFMTSCVRTFKPDGKLPRFPQIASDVRDAAVLARLGVNPNRIEIPILIRSVEKDYDKRVKDIRDKLAVYKQYGMSILLQIGANHDPAAQPLGRPRPHLEADGTMRETKSDMTPMPQFDGEFKQFVKELLASEGWPKGPVTGVMLCNEPWEGISISGWGADMIRFRELYSKLGEAAAESKKEAGVDVLVGGCDSSSNTFDKLFGEGTSEFLPYLDFCSLHYQGANPPTTYKPWLARKSPHGRVRIWDTESWQANCDDRVAAVLASNLSFGLERVVGIYSGNIASGSETWSIAASLGAVAHFIGQRAFRELLFKNGLPWVMVFDGLPDASGKPDPEDGTVVVVGDLSGAFGANALPFGNVSLSGAKMTLAANGDAYSLYDYYGNKQMKIDAGLFSSGKIVIPLDSRGFFLRGNGNKGSFAALLQAIRQARVDGVEPLAKKVHDMRSPVDQQGSQLVLELANVLNRPVKGTLTVQVDGLTAEPAVQSVAFAANETKLFPIRVAGAPKADNRYPLRVRFDAGADGLSCHEEDVRVNVIAKRRIAVDGKLDDWRDVLPQVIEAGKASGPTFTESAWLPFEKFEAGAAAGVSVGYLAYDDDFFYFAAKVADASPDGGSLRMETRDDDQFYYPPIALFKDKGGQVTECRWPEGVRRYSYRMRPVLPWTGDTVQIGFSAVDPDKKEWLPYPPGTMPGYVGYSDTDYEYVLRKVADSQGGGTEIWRDNVPGMPHKHFFPRQGKSPLDGAVKSGKLVVTQDSATRIVECALPWSELPDVKRRLEAGQTVKFSYRVNDDKGNGCMELARDRSVSKKNQFFTFRPDWSEHWANELEFSFER